MSKARYRVALVGENRWVVTAKEPVRPDEFQRVSKLFAEASERGDKSLVMSEDFEFVDERPATDLAERVKRIEKWIEEKDGVMRLRDDEGNLL